MLFHQTRQQDGSSIISFTKLSVSIETIKNCHCRLYFRSTRRELVKDLQREGHKHQHNPMLGFISEYWDLKVSETSYVMGVILLL